jgi:arylformamidase
MRILDLSQPLSPLTARSSDHPQVEFPVIRWFSRDGVRTRKVIASLHSGTHVDAPSLYDPVGLNVDELDLADFCGPALVVDVTLGARGVITAEVLTNVASGIRPGDILGLYTGWGHHAQDEETYVLKAPGLDRSGVDWIVEHQVKAVFSDTPSAEHIYCRARQWKSLRPDLFADDAYDPADFPPSYAHNTFLPAGIMMVENVSAELGQLAGQRTTLMALPVKYQGVEGAPARAIALLDFPT